MSLNSNLPVVCPTDKKICDFVGHNKKSLPYPFYSVGLIAQLVLFSFSVNNAKNICGELPAKIIEI